MSDVLKAIGYMRFFYRYEKVRGQGRPRFGKGHTYEDKKDTEYKAAITEAYKGQDGLYFGERPVEVSINFYRALPKSKQRKTKCVSEPDVYKPDIDNLAKAVLDALNGVAWADDSQVVTLSVHKYDRRPTADNLDLVEVVINAAN